MPSSPPSTSAPRARFVLALVASLALAVRVAIVFAVPDVDTDAYGHFKIARSLLSNATNLDAHWVWLPGFHFFELALIRLGLALRGVRLVDAALGALAPFLVLDLATREEGGDVASQRVASFAALLVALAPVTARMATSAQSETFFATLVLGAAWGLARDRASIAAPLLAVACVTRYEAWGATLALVVFAIATRRRAAAITAGAGVLAIAGWIALRAAHDGAPFVFLRATRDFAGAMTPTFFGGPLFGDRVIDWLVYALGFPFVALGPIAALLPLGVPRAPRASIALAAGALAFVLASYAGGGAPRLDRYFTAIVPFACVAVARASASWSARRRAAIVATVALTTIVHLGVVVARGSERAEVLRGYEASADAYE